MVGVRSEKWEVRSLNGVWGGRAARTPCALRAVILPAVQSLRLAGSEETIACWESGLVGCRASGLAPGKRQQASAFQGLRRGLFGEGRARRAGKRTPCAERAVILPAVQSLRLAGSEGAWSERAWSEGWQAHSVRRESCDSPSSPEPAALLFGGGLVVRRGLCGVHGVRSRRLRPCFSKFRKSLSRVTNWALWWMAKAAR